MLIAPANIPLQANATILERRQGLNGKIDRLLGRMANLVKRKPGLELEMNMHSQTLGNLTRIIPGETTQSGFQTLEVMIAGIARRVSSAEETVEFGKPVFEPIMR